MTHKKIFFTSYYLFKNIVARRAIDQKETKKQLKFILCLNNTKKNVLLYFLGKLIKTPRN